MLGAVLCADRTLYCVCVNPFANVLSHPVRYSFWESDAELQIVSVDSWDIASSSVPDLCVQDSQRCRMRCAVHILLIKDLLCVVCILLLVQKMRNNLQNKL